MLLDIEFSGAVVLEFITYNTQIRYGVLGADTSNQGVRREEPCVDYASL